MIYSPPDAYHHECMLDSTHTYRRFDLEVSNSRIPLLFRFKLPYFFEKNFNIKVHHFDCHAINRFFHISLYRLIVNGKLKFFYQTSE